MYVMANYVLQSG